MIVNINMIIDQSETYIQRHANNLGVMIDSSLRFKTQS